MRLEYITAVGLSLLVASMIQGADVGDKLRDAAKKGNVNSVVALLDEGADVNSVDKHGRNAIFWAAANGRLDVIDKLLTRGADPNATGEYWGPLRNRADRGSVKGNSLF